MSFVTKKKELPMDARLPGDLQDFSERLTYN